MLQSCYQRVAEELIDQELKIHQGDIMNSSRNVIRSIFLSELLSSIATSTLAVTTYNIATLPGLETNSIDSFGIAIGPTGVVVGKSY